MGGERADAGALDATSALTRPIASGSRFKFGRFRLGFRRSIGRASTSSRGTATAVAPAIIPTGGPLPDDPVVTASPLPSPPCSPPSDEPASDELAQPAPTPKQPSFIVRLAMGVLPTGRGCNRARIINRPRTVTVVQSGVPPHVLPHQIDPCPDRAMVLLSDELRRTRVSEKALQSKVNELRLQLQASVGVAGLLEVTSKRLAGQIELNAAMEVKHEESKLKQGSWLRSRYDEMRCLLREVRRASAVAVGSAHVHERAHQSNVKSLEAARARIEALKDGGKADKERLRDWDHVFSALTVNLKDSRDAASRAALECEVLESKVEALENELDEVSAERDCALEKAGVASAQVKDATKRKMGRPSGHDGAAKLSARWASMTKPARHQAFWRHCKDIESGLDAAGFDDWSMPALVRVLQWRGKIRELMSTHPICKEQMKLATGLSERSCVPSTAPNLPITS